MNFNSERIWTEVNMWQGMKFNPWWNLNAWLTYSYNVTMNRCLNYWSCNISYTVVRPLVHILYLKNWNGLAKKLKSFLCNFGNRRNLSLVQMIYHATGVQPGTYWYETIGYLHNHCKWAHLYVYKKEWNRTKIWLRNTCYTLKYNMRA